MRLRGTCHDLPLRLDIVAELEPGSGSTASSATINQLQLHVSAFVQLEIGTLIDQCVQRSHVVAHSRRCCQRIALSHLLAGVDSYASVCERRREILASLTSAFPTLAHPHEGGIIFRNERCVRASVDGLIFAGRQSWCSRSMSSPSDYPTTTTTSSQSVPRSFTSFLECLRPVLAVLLRSFTDPRSGARRFDCGHAGIDPVRVHRSAARGPSAR